jgi:RNA polymerase subunit RPABC4/transcription elongation factor Spt4
MGGTQGLPLTPCVARATAATLARDNHLGHTHTQATSTQAHKHTNTHRQPHTHSHSHTHTHTQTHSLNERHEAHPWIELQRPAQACKLACKNLAQTDQQNCCRHGIRQLTSNTGGEWDRAMLVVCAHESHKTPSATRIMYAKQGEART